MEEPILSLTSCVQAPLKKATMIRGMILGALGLALWLYGALFLPLSSLEQWGWLLLLLGGGFITWGLLPYRRLVRLENKPYKIMVTVFDELYFFTEGRLLFKIPLSKIEEIAYLDDDKRYGIGLWIRNPMESIDTSPSSLNLETYVQNCKKDYLCDVFLPYFSKRSYNELDEVFKSQRPLA